MSLKKFLNVPGTAWEKVRRLTNVDFILKFSGSNLVTFLIIFKTPIMAPHAVAALGGMSSPIHEKSNCQRLKLSPPKFRQMQYKGKFCFFPNPVNSIELFVNRFS